MNTSEVKVKKIDTAQDPGVETASWDEYDEGELNVQSPPVNYTVKGYLIGGLEEHHTMTIDRYERNGEEIHGLMRTSRIQSIDREDEKVFVETNNSLYVVEFINSNEN